MTVHALKDEGGRIERKGENGHMRRQPTRSHQAASTLFERKDVTIVATDSGLGGLSVAAELVERLKANGAFRRARVVFFNCLPSNAIGFSGMETAEQRQRVFTNALDCMVERYAADAILIACNTLSVFYDQTEFAQRSPAPVLGVVEAGTEMTAEYLRKNPRAQVVLFGTPITVESGMHKRILVGEGFDPARLICQGCAGLAMAIEHGPRGSRAIERLRPCVAEAIDKLPDRSLPTAVAFICTHFGYAADLFREFFRDGGVELAEILDPNMRMCDAFLADAPNGRFADPQVQIEVVCQSVISDVQKESVAALIAPRSEQSAAALRDHVRTPDLFAID